MPQTQSPWGVIANVVVHVTQVALGNVVPHVVEPVRRPAQVPVLLLVKDVLVAVLALVKMDVPEDVPLAVEALAKADVRVRAGEVVIMDAQDVLVDVPGLVRMVVSITRHKCLLK